MVVRYSTFLTEDRFNYQVEVDKELHLVFPAPTGEVDTRPVELEPSNAMTPEQRSESSTVNPNTVVSVPTAFALRRSTRVRKAPDRLKLGLFKFVSN
ncbi:hypothetical protein AVEN_190685-1 [Araneus ventricosus]|uniref:Uncharacterized protein n=1 Tax=Araneus ventricosus TaxID=182803 RepID=A0A4Y2Q4D2_ARAVE|nr:hypothetical protein AVEN_190685-1 [Araneus ventricosus]